MFTLVTDTIIKQMELRGNITTRLKQRIAYADDILLTTRTKQTLLDTFQKLKEILAQYWYFTFLPFLVWLSSADWLSLERER